MSLVNIINFIHVWPYRFIPLGNGSEIRQARVQTLEPKSWMKEVILISLLFAAFNV